MCMMQLSISLGNDREMRISENTFISLQLNELNEISLKPTPITEDALIIKNVHAASSLIEHSSTLPSWFNAISSCFVGSDSDPTCKDSFYFGGTYTVQGFGKILEEEDMYKEVFESIDTSSATRLKDGAELFRDCYLSHNDEEKEQYVTGNDYLEIRKKMKKNGKCIIRRNISLPYTHEDIENVYLLAVDFDMFKHTECHDNTRDGKNSVMYEEYAKYYDRSLAFQKASLEAIERIKRSQENEILFEDIDIANGLRLRAAHDATLNHFLCIAELECPVDDFNRFYSELKNSQNDFRYKLLQKASADCHHPINKMGKSPKKS